MTCEQRSPALLANTSPLMPVNDSLPIDVKKSQSKSNVSFSTLALRHEHRDTTLADGQSFGREAALDRFIAAPFMARDESGA
jgi:hypothetical protein